MAKKENENAKKETTKVVTKKEKGKKPHPQKGGGKKLKIGFLGGVGEIGKNMTVIEYGDSMIVIDAGLTFPSEEMLGVDVVIPDFSYLVENKEKVKAIICTHGHEDHIGAIPYLLQVIGNPTIYGSTLTLGLIRGKLDEFGINAKMKTVASGSEIGIDCFKVKFYKVCHSIAGALAIAIDTPQGVIFHTGDFKIDHTPIDGRTTDLARISEIGQKGVLLLMMDSTNVERNGYSMSEKKVYTSLNAQFDANEGKRIIVATFASNIHRVQQIINCAVSHNRRVAFAGRSMIKIAEIAKTLDELKYSDDAVVDIEKISKVPYDRLCIICTGTQGEPMSALTRMANDDFKKVKISDLDTVLFSASAIPGNEKPIYNVINKLSKHGADVVYSALSEIHVSGHACKEELKLMFNLLKPKYFIPMHGEYRHLMQHKELALEMGIGDANVLLPEIGYCVEVDKSGFKRAPDVKSGRLFVDKANLLSDDESLMNERKIMAMDGCVMMIVKITLTKGAVTEPIVITRGIDLGDEITAEMKNDAMSMIASGELESIGAGEAQARIKKSLTKKLQKRLASRPVIIVVAEE